MMNGDRTTEMIGFAEPARLIRTRLQQRPAGVDPGEEPHPYLISSGEYKADDQLPTVRSLAVDLDISYNTVNPRLHGFGQGGNFISTRARGGRSWPGARREAPPSPPTTHRRGCWRTT